MTAIDVLDWSHLNLWLSRAGELVVREALDSIVSVGDVVAGSKFVAGFSVRSPNTAEVWHYLATRNTTTGVGTLSITDEDFTVLTTVDLGVIPPRPIITHATISSPHVSSLEMIVGGPDIPTMYGFAGSGLLVAEAQEDEDPNTTVIEVPRGIVAGFAGRAVIANGKNLYFSNGYGTRIVDGVATFTGPRTYAPTNIGDMASIIYGMHTSEQGALMIATDSGLWGLPPSAVASGAMVRDLFEKVSDYRATGYQTTALSRSTVYGLSDLGVVRASVSNLPEIPLDEPRFPRALSEPIEVPDYRALRIWPWERGVLVSQKHAVCLVDEGRGFRAWQLAPDGYDVDVLGVLTEADGSTLYVSPDRAWSLWGKGTDADGSTVTGVASGALKTPPEDSLVLTEVTTSSDTPGNQKCSVRGSSTRTKDTPQVGGIIGTDSWSATEQYEERAIRSRRHRFAIRTDDPTVEVAAEHPGSRLSLVDVVLKGQGRKRP